MSIDVLAYAAAGGVIPDAIRVLKWARTAKGSRGRNPLRDPATYLAAIIQVVLGVLGASLLAVTTPLQATAVGYAAPDILTRVLGAAARSTTAHMGADEAKRSLLARMTIWWRQ